MPSALTIPGVQVRTVFEPSPVLPGATGVLGVVGVTDRGPMLPTPIGNLAELVEIFGPATRYTMPEVRKALANGVSRAVIARTDPSRGQKASVVLLDDEGEPVVRLQARAEGAWGNRLAVRVTPVRTLTGRGVKYVNLEVLLDGASIETFNNLTLDETSADYLFERVNEASRAIVAIDPLFETALPVVTAQTGLANAPARAATARLQAGAADVVVVRARRTGRDGNQLGVRVTTGQAGLVLLGAGDAPSVDIRARRAGADGTGIRIATTAATPDQVALIISVPGAAARSVGPFNSVANIVAGLAADADVVAVAQGTVLPAVVAATPLARRVDIEVLAEGRDPATFAHLASLAAIEAIDNPLVQFQAVAGATQLPDANEGVGLSGGRSAGPALSLAGAEGQPPLLELLPAPGVTANLEVAVSRAISSIDNTTAVTNLQVFADGELAETLTNLTMDPDDPNYLVEALDGSGLLRGIDLFVRSRASSLPRGLLRPVPLRDGISPAPADYSDALDRLEAAEEVDLVIASVDNQLNDAGIREVHQAVVAHCTKMADVARNRIGIGSVTRSESDRVPLVLDHADDVRSDHFILTAPNGSEGPVAGLLGRQDFFQSPTFKTIASPEGAVGHYTDSQLTDLVLGNVFVVNERRRLGIIAVKGLLTSGRQVNVQRTANKAVREVKAIADRYVGLLNNDGTRNALRQQIFAMLAQMERDGALVPSTSGEDPAFRVDVYSSQNDFASGIVRVDIAVRPVRAVDYVYASILVQN